MMRLMRLAGLAVFATLTSPTMTALGADPYIRPIQAAAPADNSLTPERMELGKKLFFDPRLSGSNWISCASCHHPGLGWSDGLPTAIGHGMNGLARNTPTIINTAFSKTLMWDGRFASLEQQALGPITAEGEMNQNLPELVAELSAIKGYRDEFHVAYPGEGISEQTIAKALASFERTVLCTESPFDLWRKGDQNAVSESVKRGFELFQGKANCVACHDGFNFTDDGFHNIGVKSRGAQDVGRYALKKVAINKGAFKTPTLRDVALTAPYMHNGIYRSLHEVVEHYDRGGDETDNLDPNMKSLGLTQAEKADLVEFMKSLTGQPMQVAIPQLPH